MFFIPAYIAILATTIIIDYFAGIWIAKTEGKRKKLYLIISVISTIMVLFVFKYFNFFNTNIQNIADFFHWNYPIAALEIILPIRLSFHTFQSLSYVIEVYRGHQKPEYNFGIYSLYVMFYPQLVAGPIERPQNLLHQFYEKHKFDYYRVTSGLKLMAWGLFKKVVIADRLAVVVNQVYNNPLDYEGLPLLLATFLFAFQIFCDFSGYSDIAIGSAQVMGFKLMKNFDRPYFSKSISEFWKRWHISLSTWFRDYLYISLGGNRVKKSRWYFNLFITFLVSGLWHGANWTFVIWGALHGFYLIFAILTQKIRDYINRLLFIDKVPFIKKIIQVFIVFVLVDFAWIYFRANNIAEAHWIITHMFSGIGSQLNVEWIRDNILTLASAKDYIVIVFAMVLMEIIHLIQRKSSMRELIASKPAFVRWSIYYSALLLIIFLGVFNKSEFIYFQF